MGERFKLAYIGAGSFRFSLGFFRNIVNAKALMPMEVALCDIDEKSLTTMAKILERMVKKASKKVGYNESDIKITKTVDRKSALENADFVYKSISIGMQQAEWMDNYLPIKFGIPQNTGDTVGPGGLFRALRTAPIAAGIAKDMKKLCPKAPILNYTNPQATIVMAARTVVPDIEYIGLCHELFGGMGTLQKLYNTKFDKKIPSWREMDIEYAGVNHFAWMTKIKYKEEDLYPILRENAHKLVLENFGGRGFNFHLLEKYGYFPYPGSRHVAEFNPDYYNYFNHEIQCPYWKFPKIRDVPLLDKSRRGAYFGFRQMSNWLPVPGPRKEGEMAMEMTMDWKNSVPTHHVVNLPNKGIVPELPEDCIVEVPGLFKDGKMIPAVKPIHVTKDIAALLKPHCEQHRLTVNAALGNSEDLVTKALLHDPMCKWIEDDEKVSFLAKLMLFYEQQWLPAEWKEWIPKESDLKQSKFWVSQADLAKNGKMYLQKKFPVKEELRKKAFFWE